MVKAKVTGSSDSTRRMRPALDPEAREGQMISLAEDLAEKQLRAGTASSQVITHYLKLATAKAQLEKEKLKQENKLLAAKTDAIETQKRVEELYLNALNAMKGYQGRGDQDD